MILAGDVGGTKTRLCLFEQRGEKLSRTTTETFVSNDFPHLADILRLFLGKQQIRVKRACVGVPGPVVDGTAQTTNLPWVISEAEIRETLQIQSVRLVNDLAAVAAAIPHLEDEDLLVLHEGIPTEVRRKTYAVLAPGTGLGQAFLYADASQTVVLPSEGGHVDFAPTSQEEARLFQFLQAQYSRVSYERLLSGPGLENIYRFLKETGYADEPPELAEQLRQSVPAVVISASGQAGQHKLCVKALDMFASILGAQAGNLALTLLTTGGVYLGGGIPPKICKKLRDGTAQKAYLAKCRMASLVENMPLLVIRDEHTALLGAAYLASEL